MAYLKRHLPSCEIVNDPGGGAMHCFREALRLAGDDPVVHMEDDVVLTEFFEDKIMAEIASRPNQVCQFFSMRKADLEQGSRVDPGAKFLMGQCFYLPAGVSADLLIYSNDWPGLDKHPTGLDSMVADYLKSKKMNYYLHVPSLVDHRPVVSRIDSRRSKKRQSLTFVNPVGA